MTPFRPKLMDPNVFEAPDEWKDVAPIEDVKLYRTKTFLMHFNPRQTLETNGIVPVVSNGKTIGSVGEIYEDADGGMDGTAYLDVELILLYSTPERLDLESGHSLWAKPIYSETGTTIKLEKVEIVTESTGHTPIGH